jgi:pSer/pThr/pTyr-binding forkhead associated (FHA) protein
LPDTAAQEPSSTADDLQESTCLSRATPTPSRPAAAASLSVALRVVEGPDRGRVFRVVGSEITVGRGDVQVRLDDPEVSRQHCVIRGLGGRFMVADLGTTNGTYVDELRVGEAFVVAGQELKLGSTVLKLEEVRAVSAAD